MEAGEFRADLFFRLCGLSLKLPNLRSRKDLLLLAEYILAEIPYKNEYTELTDDAKSFILEYYWPGNFRELQNVLGQAVFLADNGPITRGTLRALCPVSTTLEKGQMPIGNQETFKNMKPNLLEKRWKEQMEILVPPQNNLTSAEIHFIEKWESTEFPIKSKSFIGYKKRE